MNSPLQYLLDHLENIQMEENHAYEVVNKTTCSDIKDMEPCPAYGVAVTIIDS